MVASCSPRAMRAVQRARLWAITWTASQAPLAAKRPEGRWLSPTPYLRSRMAFSISAWRRWSASSSRVYSVPVGDEGVIAVAGEEGQLGTGGGFHPPDDEPHRRGAGLALEGGAEPGLGSILADVYRLSKRAHGTKEQYLSRYHAWDARLIR